MRDLFGGRKSNSTPLPNERTPRSTAPTPQSHRAIRKDNEATGTGTGTVTDYRSFAEYRSENRSQGSNTSSSRNRSATEPINLMQSHEVLLGNQRNLHHNEYRGFSTSMHDMYTATEFERVDCCSMACGGILQSDRDRYLLHGITPPTIARRFWLHIVFPVSLLALAASAAMRIPEKSVNQMFCTGIVIILIGYFALQCWKGQYKRMDIRKDLLWTKAQLQEDPDQNLAVLLEQQAPDDHDKDQEYYLGQTQRDFKCAHPCCLIGCYAEDRAAYEMRFSRNNETGEEENRVNRRQVARDARRRQASVARCMFDYACPAIWCGHQLQCCGICALAQEAREVESAVLPASYRRIDYISMQPISHYYPAIYKKRHYRALPAADSVSSGDTRSSGDGIMRSSSRRSRRSRGSSELGRDIALQSPGAGGNQSTGGTANNDSGYVPPRFVLSNLSWQLLQFALTITVLVFLWCILGKYFWKNALGLAVPEWRIFDWTDFIVFVACWFQAIALTAIIAMLCNRPCPTHLSLDAMIKYFAAGFCLSTVLAVFWELFLGVFTKAFLALIMSISGVDVVVDEDGYTSTNWMVVGASNFARSIAGETETDNFLRAFGNKHPAFYTVYLFFSAFFLAAFVEEACKYFGYRMVEHPDFMSQREIEDAMTVVIQQRADDDEDDENAPTRRIGARPREGEQTDFSKQKKSVQSLGGAITLAMICVAMGFTCCENLVYIFIYSGSSIGMEISVLVARSFFPVHPIAAALQSIYVIERDVEVTRTARLGKILTPAVLMHGSYDFFILWIDFMSQLNGNYLQVKFDLAGFSSFILSALIIVGSVVYYMIQASKQRSRLQVTDYSIESGQSVLV